MKAKHQKELARIVEEIGDLRAQLGDLATELETIFDDKSEHWQDSESGQDSQAEIDAIRAAEESALAAEETLQELA